MGQLKTLRKAKMIEQKGRCYYCGLMMWDEGTQATTKALRCTAEHLHPRGEGGRDTANNIVAACLFCNGHRHRRKKVPSPQNYRALVQRRMARGRWLAEAAPA